MCFDFLYNFGPKHFILKITEQNMIKNAHWSSCKSTHYSSQILVKLEFSRQTFEK
jgi:hypothetical protein